MSNVSVVNCLLILILQDVFACDVLEQHTYPLFSTGSTKEDNKSSRND